jgi:hypothetical protein
MVPTLHGKSHQCRPFPTREESTASFIKHLRAHCAASPPLGHLSDAPVRLTPQRLFEILQASRVEEIQLLLDAFEVP